MTQLLLSYTPDLEARDTMGWTPLMVAGELLDVLTGLHKIHDN